MAWTTVKTIIAARQGRQLPKRHGIDTAFANYGRLSAATAQRVVRFWQVRPAS